MLIPAHEGRQTMERQHIFCRARPLAPLELKHGPGAESLGGETLLAKTRQQCASEIHSLRNGDPVARPSRRLLDGG